MKTLNTEEIAEITGGVVAGGCVVIIKPFPLPFPLPEVEDPLTPAPFPIIL